MKCPKCGNEDSTKMSIQGITGLRCDLCHNDEGKGTWVKWATKAELYARECALNEKNKKDMYHRLLSLSMKNMTITITNIVMKFVEADKKPTREEVGLAVWNWLKRK